MIYRRAKLLRVEDRVMIGANSFRVLAAAPLVDDRVDLLLERRDERLARLALCSSDLVEMAINGVVA